MKYAHRSAPHLLTEKGVGCKQYGRCRHRRFVCWTYAPCGQPLIGNDCLGNGLICTCLFGSVQPQTLRSYAGLRFPNQVVVQISREKFIPIYSYIVVSFKRSKRSREITHYPWYWCSSNGFRARCDLAKTATVNPNTRKRAHESERAAPTNIQTEHNSVDGNFHHTNSAKGKCMY